jgi:hypothetical protein
MRGSRWNFWLRSFLVGRGSFCWSRVQCLPRRCGGSRFAQDRERSRRRGSGRPRRPSKTSEAFFDRSVPSRKSQDETYRDQHKPQYGELKFEAFLNRFFGKIKI